MKIHEYIAKEIFKAEGIPVPASQMVKNSEDAHKAALEINKQVAIKSQILVGGRGKAGGIQFATDPDEARDVSSKILGSTGGRKIVH